MNLSHRTLPVFWRYYNKLPLEIQDLADKNYILLKQNPLHPSLHLKRVGSRWSVRVGLNYRALALEKPDGLYWVWIGPHDEYDKILSR